MAMKQTATINIIRYYYRTLDGETIYSLGTASKVPNRTGYVEITADQYNGYMATLNSIEDREGFIKRVTLFIDGTYSVDYVAID